MRNRIALGNPNQSEQNLNFNCGGWNGTNINNTPPCFLAAKARVCCLPNRVFLPGVFSPEQQRESVVVMEEPGVHDCGVCALWPQYAGLLMAVSLLGAFKGFLRFL